MHRWYALHTKPRSENTLSQLLALKGIMVYLPQVPKIGHGHRQKVTEPLFPSYLFANIDLDTLSFASFRWTPGLRDVVNAADGPAPVDDSIIEHIQKRLADKDVLLSAAHERFRPHERVRLKGNTLEDLNVVFDHYLPGEARARVLIHILGRKTPAEVAIDSLQKASALRN